MIHPRLYEKLHAGSENTASFPVILYYCKPRTEVRQCILRRYGPIKYELPFIHAMALDLPAHKLKAIAREPMVQWITEDVTVSKVGDGNPLRQWVEFRWLDVPLPTKRRSVAVAVIDTGVAPHPDLIQPVNRIRAFYDLIHHKTEPYDDDGHGTHIAGILCGLAGGPGRSASAERWSPTLVAIKALDEKGNGNASDILAAMQWTLNNSAFYNIRVVNLSLGVTADDDYDNDPLVKGVEALTRRGFTVVTAAGNSGPKPGTISSPGICKSAITVGAIDNTSDKLRIASFSSRGPTPQGWIKPDLLAPGVDILSLDAESVPSTNQQGREERTAASQPSAAVQNRRVSGPPGYIAQSGTSMAAPWVSRAAAGIYERFPGLDPATVKRILLNRAIPLKGEPPEAQGRGVLIP